MSPRHLCQNQCKDKKTFSIHITFAQFTERNHGWSYIVNSYLIVETQRKRLVYSKSLFTHFLINAIPYTEPYLMFPKLGESRRP